MKKSLLFPILATGAICLATPGFAASETSSLSVSATVIDFCTVTAGTGLAFGNFDTGQTKAEDTPGSIAVVCSSSKTGVSVTLAGGANASGAQRYMKDAGTNLLPYNMHADSGHSNAVAIDGEIYGGNLTAAVPVVIPVYGQIPAGNYSVGVYSDTVTVTLTYP